jgi:CCR4-NOT transcription complex subunit 7/8
MDAVRPVPVWKSNLGAVSADLRRVAPRATHVAFNVQYPGCVVHGDSKRHYSSLTAEERYAFVRKNVNPLQPLQVGLAVRTDDGELYAWEVNLCNFDILSDYYRRAPESIAYLASRGLDFYQLRYDGIPGYRLRWLLRDSGLIRACPEWTTFTGGYHVAYMVKLLTGEPLPPELDAFMYLVRDKIGTRIYDVKLLAREHDQGCRGPLKVVAKQLGAVNTEEQQQDGNGIAGAAAVLALQAFEVLKDEMGDGRDKYRRQLCGIQTF